MHERLTGKQKRYIRDKGGMLHDTVINMHIVLIIKAMNMELNFKWGYKNIGNGEGKNNFKRLLSRLSLKKETI